MLSKDEAQDNEEKAEASSSQAIQVFRGADEAAALSIRTLERAQVKVDICIESVDTILGFDPIKAIIEASKRGVKIRLITEILPKNVAASSALMEYGELRHLSGVRGNFAVTESEFFGYGVIEKKTDAIPSSPVETLYSRMRSVVEEHAFLFETLWNNSISAEERITQIQRGEKRPETKVVRGPDEVRELFLTLIEEARSDVIRPALNIVGDRDIPSLLTSEGIFAKLSEAIKGNPKFKVRFITDIGHGNLADVNKLRGAGIQVSHFDGIKLKFGVSSLAYFETSRDLRNGLPDEMVWSNSPDMISQSLQMFQMLWDIALPAEAKIQQMERHLELGETRLVNDIIEEAKLSQELANNSRREILLIVASQKVIERNASVYPNLAKRAAQNEIAIRMLAPVFDEETASLLSGISWKSIKPINVGISIYDREKMLITQYMDAEGAGETKKTAMISNIFTTNRQTINGIVSIFEMLWHESELREREEKSRRQAELLQDILTHDIRNYNQVSRLSAELLRDELQDNVGVSMLTTTLLEAIDGSTVLVERAKKLGRILSEEKPRLYPFSLLDSLDRALLLVSRANPEKLVRYNHEIFKQQGAVEVLADELLDDVFTNLFSNAVRYTPGTEVQLELGLELTSDGFESSRAKSSQAGEGDKNSCSSGNSYWKVTISDHGKGIPEEIKANIFARYLQSAKGSGLGMSIVHALVVERYHGKIKIDNRVQRDYSKGTTITLWIPCAANPSEKRNGSLTSMPMPLEQQQV